MPVPDADTKRPSPTILAETATARSARRKRGIAGSRARERELLATSYFHVVFTVPHELHVLALDNQRVLFDLLFTASARTLLGVAADPQHLGAEIGVISILHTWGQNLLQNPHS